MAGGRSLAIVSLSLAQDRISSYTSIDSVQALRAGFWSSYSNISRLQITTSNNNQNRIELYDMQFYKHS
jgi:hypothetical protein